jgi:hypothetical protein
MRSTVLIMFFGALLLIACSSSKNAEVNQGNPTVPAHSATIIPGSESTNSPNGGAGGYDDVQLRTMAGNLDSAIGQLQKDAAAVQPALSEVIIGKLQSLQESSSNLLKHADQGVTVTDEINPSF